MFYKLCAALCTVAIVYNSFRVPAPTNVTNNYYEEVIGEQLPDDATMELWAEFRNKKQ